VQSPNFGARREGEAITLAIVHSISLPPGEYGGSAVERFFTNRLDVSVHPYFEHIGALRVSAHFFIGRRGEVVQFVSCDHRAWHAGTSQWRGRDNCNDWSIGIELEGLEGECFERTQYRALVRLLNALRTHYPLAEVVGHEHVAAGRKADPGARFEWRRLARAFKGRLATAHGPAKTT
jgi:AmpD protein